MTFLFADTVPFGAGANANIDGLAANHVSFAVLEGKYHFKGLPKGDKIELVK